MTIPAYPLAWPDGWKRIGNVVEISLRHGVGLLDVEDATFLRYLTWYSHQEATNCYMRADPYAYGVRKTYLAHRLVMAAAAGEIVDHINGNGLDNRRGNLRIATSAENTRNSRPRGGVSQFKGVAFDRRCSRPWIAQITANRHHRSISGFDKELTAAAAYDIMAAQEHGEFARFNLGVLNLVRDRSGAWVPAAPRNSTPKQFQRVQRAYEAATK